MVWHSVVPPSAALVSAVQTSVPTQPVSAVWQLTVRPLVGPEAVQEETFTQPVSVVWQTVEPEGVQLDASDQVAVPVRQSTEFEPS
jgi:hypothetical protein